MELVGNGATQNNDMVKLREFVDRLNKLDIHASGKSGTLIMENGPESHGISLFSVNHASILLWKIEPNSASHIHVHDSSEWIIVYGGAIYLYANDVSKIISDKWSGKDLIRLDVGNFAFIPPEVGHYVKSENGADLIVIAVPRADEFPR